MRRLDVLRARADWIQTPPHFHSKLGEANSFTKFLQRCMFLRSSRRKSLERHWVFQEMIEIFEVMLSVVQSLFFSSTLELYRLRSLNYRIDFTVSEIPQCLDLLECCKSTSYFPWSSLFQKLKRSCWCSGMSNRICFLLTNLSRHLYAFQLEMLCACVPGSLASRIFQTV